MKRKKQEQKKTINFEKCKMYGKSFTIFLFNLCISVVFSSSLSLCIKRVYNINTTCFLLLFSLTSLFITLVFTLIKCAQVFNWKNFANRLLGKTVKNFSGQIFFSVLFLSSILFSFLEQSSEWDAARKNSIIAITWTILGLSIALFALWYRALQNILNEIQLGNKNEVECINKIPIRIKQEQQKQELYGMLFNLVLVFLALIFSILSTTQALVIDKLNYGALQTLLVLSFYLSTNALISILGDIALPIVKSLVVLSDNTKPNKHNMNL